MSCNNRQPVPQGDAAVSQSVEDVLSSAMTDDRMKRTPGTYCSLKYKNSVYYSFSTRHTHTHVHNCKTKELFSQGRE